MKYYTCDRETWTIIDEFETLEDAKTALEKYEETDKADGIFEKDFYDIIDENRESQVY